jgi:hypothetical protein
MQHNSSNDMIQDKLQSFELENVFGEKSQDIQNVFLNDIDQDDVVLDKNINFNDLYLYD